MDIEGKLSLLENRLNYIYQILDNVQSTTSMKTDYLEKEIKDIREEIKKIRDSIDNLNIKIQAIIDQLELFAPAERVAAIEKLLDMIDPLNYVTKKEVEKIVEEKVKEMLGKL